ncbi:MAG TPA: T9SS type A sorting domain-containing protein [Flavobacterium sp.]|uniref:T9SS type A sorting domain-containing protein n=1 Tax=Flavobacterium sp. TaxID=239 RepID=UPI002C625CA4|nr:T9SS type A sorting domain-containing protein [Flavobacterium sp.]HSD13092.1 T9SS type A sorting domain-containing protein [Flavobacterium sp.]
MKTNTFSQIPIINLFRYIFLSSIILMSSNALCQNVYSTLFEEWVNSNWGKSYQTIYTYNGANHLILISGYLWITPPGEWQNESQTIHTNNPDGTVYQGVIQVWHAETSTWLNLIRSTYTYNASQKVLTTTTELATDTWRNSTLETNTYDGSGYLIYYLSQNWDNISSWKNALQTTYTNNPSGNVNQSITQEWSPSETWVNKERRTYTYTAANKVLTQISENWNGSAWVNSYKITDTYNGAELSTVTLYQIWNGSVWVDNIRSLVTYDGSNNIYQSVNQKWITNAWVNESRMTFGYTLGTEDFSLEKNLLLYPNPSSEKITVKTNQYQDNPTYFITDQTGRLIKKGQLNDMETTIDISQMTRGLYFFRIDDNHKNSIKLIKN